MTKKVSNVGYNTNLIIGGKKYNSTDISRLKQQTKEIYTVTGTENAPRHISKVLNNEAGTIKTNNLEYRQPVANSSFTVQTMSKSIVSSQTSKISINTSSTSTSSEEQIEGTNKINITSSKVPMQQIQGISMGTGAFTNFTTVQYNNRAKTNIDTSKIQTKSMLDKAAVMRAQQAMLQGSYTPSNIIKNIRVEAKASFYEAMAHYNDVKKNNFSTGGRKIVNKAQETFASNDDMGNQVISGAITTGITGYTSFKLAQTASPVVIKSVQSLPNGIVATKKGVWDVTTTAGKATVTLVKTAKILSSDFIPFNSRLTKNVLLNQAQITGLLHTATSKHIISTINHIQTNLINMKNNIVNTSNAIKTGIVTTTNAVKRSYNLVRGMANGTVMSSVVAHQALQNISYFSKKTGIKSLNLVTRGTVKGGVWTLKRGIPKSIKTIDSTSIGLANMLNKSNDMMLQGIGNAITLTNYSIKTSVVTGRVTGRVVKTSVKNGIKTTKSTYNAINFVRQKGLRTAWNIGKKKMATAVINSGKSLVTAVVNLVRALGSKVVVPIILIAVTASVVTSIFAAPTVAIGGIFSGLFDMDTGNGTTETDIRAFITDPTNGIPAKRTAYINDLYQRMQKELKRNGGNYDYVRFKTNTQDNLIEPTISGITSVFYTEEDLANIIQPIFNAILIKDYELAPTEVQAKQVLKENFDKLFRITEETEIEYCGQDVKDGSGMPAVHTCGNIHATGDCPNPVSGTHTTYTCSSCCYYTCDGHIGSDIGSDIGSNSDSDSDSNSIPVTFCEGCIHKCSGYIHCGGHNIITITLNMDGLYQLLYEYFEDPIDVLSNKSNRTREEERELANLKDYYEICLEYIKQVSRDYGSGLTMENLSGVTWINGSRVGNQAIIDLALSQVGQVGGQPYWSWYGFNSRVEWCACFVSWCMNQTGHSEVKYASCQYGGVPYFQKLGRWANGGYTDLVAGDVIFFDWNGDGKANHTGLVIGTDGEYVYTVEGNSGDICKTKKYPINSSVILGYGLMNY